MAMLSVYAWAALTVAVSTATAAEISTRDLHPAVADVSYAYAVSGPVQAGYVSQGNSHAALWTGTAGSARLGGVNYAALWSGTPDSFVDLQAALGDAYSSSAAQGLWTDGTNPFVAGYATTADTGSYHAILWVLTPKTGMVELTVVSGGGAVTVSWPYPATGFVLESENQLDPPPGCP